MTEAEDASLAGKLLVASPALTDPNFNRSVIFMIRHNVEGAFGLVINRPLEQAPLDEHIPEWSGTAAPPAFVFGGGPVDPSVAFALGRFPENALPPGEALMPGIAVVDLSTPESRPDALETIRVYSGYAGWSPGQLEAELKESAWFVIDAQPSDIFAPEPKTLWRDVLKRQRGALAMFAYFPANPSAN